MMLRKLAIAVAVVTASLGAADATTLIEYDLSGTVSGTNFGVPFVDAPYEFSFIADRDTLVAATFGTTSGYVIDPVISAALVSPFFVNFAMPIRIGLNTTTDRFFFGASAPGSFDAVALSLTADEVSTIVGNVTFGPQAGSAQFFFDGLFTILGDSLPPGVVFSGGSATGELIASAVPEASTWIMMILGFAGVGFASLRGTSRRNKMALQTN